MKSLILDRESLRAVIILADVQDDFANLLRQEVDGLVYADLPERAGIRLVSEQERREGSWSHDAICLYRNRERPTVKAEVAIYHTSGERAGVVPMRDLYYLYLSVLEGREGGGGVYRIYSGRPLPDEVDLHFAVDIGSTDARATLEEAERIHAEVVREAFGLAGTPEGEAIVAAGRKRVDPVIDAVEYLEIAPGDVEANAARLGTFLDRGEMEITGRYEHLRALVRLTRDETGRYSIRCTRAGAFKIATKIPLPARYVTVWLEAHHAPPGAFRWETGVGDRLVAAFFGREAQ